MTPSYTYTLHFHGQPLVLAVWGTRLLVHTASVEAIIGRTISFEAGSFEDTYFSGRYFPIFHAGAFVYTYPIGRHLFTWLSNIRVHGSRLILPNGHKLPMPAAPFSPLPRWQQTPQPIYPLQPVSLYSISKSESRVKTRLQKTTPKYTQYIHAQAPLSLWRGAGGEVLINQLKQQI